jgi:DNA-binding phage protein
MHVGMARFHRGVGMETNSNTLYKAFKQASNPDLIRVM